MVNVENTSVVRKMLGVPSHLVSCHTAKIGRYFIEGHVPASDIKRLISEKPDIKGLVVPGMPGGSPGMESAPYEPYKVLSVDENDGIQEFATH